MTDVKSAILLAKYDKKWVRLLLTVARKGSSNFLLLATWDLRGNKLRAKFLLEWHLKGLELLMVEFVFQE